jgi:hypothetical protein
MMENTVAYTLKAQTQGLQDLQLFRAELAGLKDLQGSFCADMGFGQQQRESIKATSVDLSGLEFQILGLTDSIKVLDGTMGKLGQSSSNAGQKTKAAFTGLDPTIAETVRTVRTLLTEFQNGNIKATEFGAGMQKAKAELIAMSTQNSLGTRELQAISGALNIVAKAYGEANTASSPYLAGLKQQQIAMNEVKGTSMALNQEVLNTRRAYQEEKIDAAQLAETMTSLGIRANALLAPLQAQKDAILALGVPTREQTLELQRLEGQITGFSQAAQRAAAGVDLAMGRITKGGFAAGVQSGMAGLNATIKETISDTQRLIEAEKAHTITREQAVLGLTDQANAQRAALRAMQDEANGLRLLGVLDVQQTERLGVLEVGEQGYTRALAGTTTALEAQVKAQQAAAAAALRTQEQQQGAQRAAAGSALGIRGAGGMNNAAMAAMFINPELGMVAMAASMGPIVAGAAAVGLFAKAIGDGIDKAAVFQRSLQQIGAISGQSAEQMNQYGTYIQHLSTELPVSTQRLAEMGREAVMVGLHGPEGMRVYTETMAAFSVITRDANGNLGHTAEVGQEVVKILRSTGATTEEVTVGFGRMINGLVGLKTESGVAIPQVTALLKFWSSQGHAVGLTIEQMAGLSAALIQTGARAQGAGGAMAKFFDTAESAAATGGAKLQSWANVVGLSAEKTKELLKQDPMEFLRRFVSGAEAMDRGGKALSLTLGSVSLNSAQVRRTFAELVNALPLVSGNIKIMTDASDDQGLAMRKAIDATNDYKDKITLLGQGFDLLKTNMAMAVLPGMTAVLGWALSLSQALNDAVTYQGKLGKALAEGKAAPGTQTYDLPSWLKNSGLSITQLSADQQKQVTGILAQMQTAANKMTQQGNIISGMPIPQAARDALKNSNDTFYTEQIGRLGAKLAQFQEAASFYGPKAGPLSAAQQAAGGTTGGYAEAGNEIGHQLAAYAVAGIHGATTSVAGECSKFVKEVFQQAFPTAGRALFGGTANATRDNFNKAGLLSAYGGDPSKLREGQVVFNKNDPSGDGHVGVVVIVGGQKYVAENSSVVAGRSATGDACALTPIARFGPITDVGDVNGYGKIAGSLSKNGPDSGDGSASAPKSLAAYVAEVTRLQAAIDKARKDGNQKAWESAKASLAAFTSENKDMVALATEWISGQAKTAKAALKDMGLSDADWAKYKTRATELAGLQTKRDTLTQPQALKLDRDMASFNSDPVKAKALQFATQQLSDQKALAAQTKQDSDKAAADAVHLAERVATGKITASQDVVNKLKQAQDNELANADTAAQKLAIIEKTSGALHKAAMDTAAAEREKAYATAKAEKDPATATQDRLDADAAYSRAQSAADLAQTQAINTAKKAQSAEAKQIAKEQRDTLARLTTELRQGNIQKAQDELATLGQLRERDLAGAKDNAVQKLAITKRYGDLEYNAAVQVAAAIRDKALKDSANSHTLGTKADSAAQQAANDAANRAYDLAVGAAGNTRSSAVTQATDTQTSAIQKQRDAYSKLADSLRAHVLAGDLDAQTQHDLTKQFNDLGRETDKLGLTNDKYVKGARVATYALFDQGQAAYLTAQRAQGMVSGNDAAAESALQLATDLQSLGDEQGGVDALQASYDSLTAALANGEVSAAEVEKVQLALETLQSSLGTQAAVNDWLSNLDGSIDEELQAITAKLNDPNTTIPFKKALVAAAVDVGGSFAPGSSMGEAAAEAIKTRLDEDLNPTLASLEKRVKVIMADNRDPTTDSGLIQYLDAVIARGGEAGVIAKQFKDNLDNLVNTLAAPSLVDVLNNPGAYLDGARGADGIPNAGPDASVTAALQSRLDTQRTQAIKDMTAAELDAAVAADTLSGNGKDLSLVLGEIDTRAKAATAALLTLPGDKVQSQLNALGRNKSTIDPKDFLLQQRDLQTTLEIDRFAEIATPTENQSIAHHDKLLQIYADYVTGMEALGVTAFNPNASKLRGSC